MTFTAESGCVSRRRFLAGAGAAVAAPCFVPGSALGLSGAIAAGERITIGVIGVGNRGTANMKGLMACPDAQVIAVCDCRRDRLEKSQRTVAAHYAKGGGQSHSGCDALGDYRDVITRDDIDAIVVTPPDHWHGIVATQALNEGKDLYCEKPIARTVAEIQAVAAAVKKNGRVLQTGTQQRSGAHFRRACELARNGYLGKIGRVEVAVPAGGSMPAAAPCPVPEGFNYDMWTGPAPYSPFDAKRCEWLAMYWISDYCTGFICNWGVHHLDIAQWGVPEITEKPFELEGKAVFPSGGMCDTAMLWNIDLRYESGLLMNFTSAADMTWTKNNSSEISESTVAGMGTLHEQGCRFIGDKGWVHVNRKGIKAEPASLLEVQLKPNETPLHKSDDHYADFIQSVKSRKDPVAPITAGHRASVLGNIADIGVRLGRKIKWDPVEEHFFGDEEATAMLSRSMRRPWSM